MVIHLDRMRGAERSPVLDRQLRPGGMGDGDKGARRPRPLRQFRRALIRSGVRKIERQAGRDDVPVFADAGPHGVDFGADQGGEIAAAQLAGVGDRPIEPAKKMIRHLQEIIARALIGLDDVHGVQGAVGKGRVGV